jgi:hypothetical protein
MKVREYTPNMVLQTHLNHPTFANDFKNRKNEFTVFLYVYVLHVLLPKADSV